MTQGRRDTESMASSMQSKMSDDPIISPEACIFRIPSILYRHNEKAYIPNAFSIGPFHHGKENLKQTEKIKFKYLQGLVHRTGPMTKLMECIDAIKQVEKKARECYAEEINMSEEKFVEMLVLDGCFIIELFRKEAGEVPKEVQDPIFSRCCMCQFLWHDLILLENQIPWFVLDCLFSLTSPFKSKPLVQLALEFFCGIFSPEQTLTDLTLFANQDIKHILDLLRSSLLLPLPEEHSPHVPKKWKSFPSASVIKESGIKFKKVDSTTILKVRFVKDTLEIPSFYIHEITEPIFRNLISYEQCYPDCSPRFTCYAILLDNLINTEEDLATLCKNEILTNWLYPEDAMQMFKVLYRDACVSEFYYQTLCEQVIEYGNKLWPKWRAFYYHNYFGKPWAIVSQIVAAILLSLTILQTIYSMMPRN